MTRSALWLLWREQEEHVRPITLLTPGQDRFAADANVGRDGEASAGKRWTYGEFNDFIAEIMLTSGRTS
jgi:hypothetical protein